ncbi:MAG: hypothetical protein K5696_00375 [Lachnospiraceae bacterium]|nr:hypothetical protein [Lachnospiraceae bacterium]
MRQYQKKTCLETLSVLQDAHAEVVRFATECQNAEAAMLLEQCQQAAISVGTMIDQAEGDGTGEVHLLEAYCEQIYLFHEDLQNGASVDALQRKEQLDQLLQQASGGIAHRLPTSREVVFLPYKASMWDSLESVWREASADPDTTVRVIPIPYYDKNPDGSFQKLHYEGDQFPKEVTVTHYMDYPLAQHHPEVIYIHNPYDEANHITSVHPAFYSAKLREMTEELIYIPYFILGEIDPHNSLALEGAEKFIALPGVVNAHRVIVQSENWRQAYINVMIKHAGEDTRALWEEKITVGESPKLNRVRHLEESDYFLPEEWQRLTEKPDGSRKKIILYNTGITALLENNDRMLDKISRVLAFFKENSDEVTLLWRPHPLTGATLNAMRPQLQERYRQLVDSYQAEAWGIYDDSPDLPRAIAVSDAYYGDHSSLVQLYQETGKPIMIQNVYV